MPPTRANIRLFQPSCNCRGNHQRLCRTTVRELVELDDAVYELIQRCVAVCSGDEPFILPSHPYHHVRELLESSHSIFATALIDVLQLNVHASPMQKSATVGSFKVVPPNLA